MPTDMISADFIVDRNSLGKFYNNSYSYVEDNFSCDKLHEDDCKTIRKQHELWKTRSYCNVFEELFVRGNCVVLSRFTEESSRFPFIKLSMESPVISAHWTSFLLANKYTDEFEVNRGILCDDQIQSGVSVFESQRCTFFEDNGATYISRLPFRVEAAWPLHSCVILERYINNDEQIKQCQNMSQKPFINFSNTTLPNSPYFAPKDPKTENSTLFTLFLMSHPLDEMTPILLKFPNFSGGSPRLCFANDVNQRIVGVIASLSLLITINVKTRLHSIWRLEKAHSEEYAHLYVLGDDRRITVAPDALAVDDIMNLKVLSTTALGPVLSTPIEMISNSSNTTSNFPLTPSNQHPQQYSSSPIHCLSPFRASLQRFKTDMRACAIRLPSISKDASITDHLNNNATMYSCHDGVPQSPSLYLDEHIRRLSAVSFVPPLLPTNNANAFSSKNVTSVFPDDTQLSVFSIQSSFISEAQSFRNHRRASSGFINKPRSRQNSRTFGYSTIPGVFATASHPPVDSPLIEPLGPDGREIGMDEPLLPKACLCLLWSEPPFTSDASIAPDFVCSLSSAALPRTPKLGRNISEILPNPRIAALTRNYSSYKVNKSEEPTSETTDEMVDVWHENGPQRNRVFVAKDMVDTLWVCFLTKNRQDGDRLACLRVQSKAGGGLNDDAEAIVLDTLTYLPAVDVVYVPDSRLIVCLEASRSIVLYSGIVKVCLLGVIPSPVATRIPTVNNNENNIEIMNSAHLRPLTIRPSLSDMIIASAKDKISQLFSVFGNSCKISDEFLQQNLEVTTSHIRPIIIAQKSNTPNKDRSIQDSWRLCLPVGRHFTLALIKPHGNDSSVDYYQSNFEKQLHIQLPPLSTDFLVERCLNGLRKGLPANIGLDLLIQWFKHRNPPNNSQLSNSPAFISACRPHLEQEILLFCRFLLQILGVHITPCENEDDDEEGSAMQISPPLCPNSGEKRHRHSQETDDEKTGKVETSSDDWLLNEVLSSSSSHTVLNINELKTRNPQKWNLIRHLPNILLCLHLVFENEKLDILLTKQLKVLGLLNHILARHIKLSSYVEYYSSSGFSILSARDCAALPTMSTGVIRALVWPSSLPSNQTPALCLTSWVIHQLLRVNSEQPTCVYLHLPDVNDFAVSLASFILLAVLRRTRLNPEMDVFEAAVSLWETEIKSMEEMECVNEIADAYDNTPDSVKQAAGNPILLSFAIAVVYTEKKRRTSQTAKTVGCKVELSENEELFAFQQAVLFVNELAIHAPLCQYRLTENPTRLTPAYASILHSIFTGCTAKPPSNCSANVYRLIGREDLARQFEIMCLPSLSPTVTKINAAGHPVSQKRILCSQWQVPTNRDDQRHTWSPAERWANLVRPLRQTPSIHHRHFLLACLENNPACQVSFAKDLRLQEAYRLLQTSSHIWLPRICADVSTFGPPLFSNNNQNNAATGADGANASSGQVHQGTARARLDMHLAAASVRTSALPVGKGMLGLGLLTGLGLPSRLPVYPICWRGRALVNSSALPVHQDLARGSLAETGVNGGAGSISTAVGQGGLRGNGQDAPDQASDHPGNAMALAIVTAVVACGTATSLKTACSISRLLQPKETLQAMNEGGGAGQMISMRRLVSLASNAALAAASAVSSSSILQTPSVLAAKYWPDFHNGVAAALMVSPHASVDATWIVQNCKAIALGSSPITPAPASNQSGAGGVLPTNVYSPTQAGFLLGLGLNGHLNKLSAHYIREFTVQVHDLTNAAVILGLCAGKRATMDQAILRLLAVHYRPLLTPDPVLVDVILPSLCQASAAFGLGLLFQGSAHRHIASILLAELGRPLGATLPSDAAAVNERSSAGGGGGTNTNDPATQDTSQTPGSTRNQCAGGSGGFAADGRELISLSAGFALGLVMLQRGDSPCGLSDLAVSQTLHSYMTGGARDSTSINLEGDEIDALTMNMPRPLPGYPLPSSLQPHLLPLRSRRSNGLRKACTGQNRHNHSNIDSFLATANDISSIPVDELADLGFVTGAGVRSVATDASHLLATVDPLDTLLQQAESVFLATNSNGVAGDSGTPFLATPGTAARRSGTAGRQDLAGSVISRARRTEPSPTVSSNGPNAKRWNQQIREGDMFNCDVSAPGAIMALGFVYLATGNETVSQWLRAPITPRGLDSVRPDFLLFQTIAFGLVNWNTVEASTDWIQSLLPPFIIKALRKPPTASTLTNKKSALGEDAFTMETEDDVENRQPSIVLPAPVNVATSSGDGISYNLRHHRQPLSPKIPTIRSVNSFMRDTSKPPPVDYATISMAYLNILTGACFSIGLKFAGTCNPKATELLHEIMLSFLLGSWWPPNRYPSQHCSTSAKKSHPSSMPPKLTELPPIETTVQEATATCLLALSMVVAGSGNLTVLRMVRKLRAIRLFGPHQKKPSTTSSSQQRVWPSADELARGYHVAATAAQAAANVQAMPSASPTTQPVSTASILGSLLAPNFGLQMIYGSCVGLLFLGGGRLTLSNTPEAAAFLTIAFFPRYPIYAGDNWYHLQCLRHLYVLATRPRRICAVDVSTNQVVPINMRATCKESGGFFESRDTAVVPSGLWEKLSSVELNFGSLEYLPSNFCTGTNEWSLLKRSAQETGYVFVKRKLDVKIIDNLEFWTRICLLNWRQPNCMWQLKLMKSFLSVRANNNKSDTEKTIGEYEFLAKTLSSQVIKQFVDSSNELCVGLRAYFLGKTNEQWWGLNKEVRTAVIAFRIWFSLPTAKLIQAYLPNGHEPVDLSLPTFLTALKPLKKVMDAPALYWLHKFLYTNQTYI